MNEEKAKELAIRLDRVRKWHLAQAEMCQAASNSAVDPMLRHAWKALCEEHGQMAVEVIGIRHQVLTRD